MNLAFLIAHVGSARRPVRADSGPKRNPTLSEKHTNPGLSQELLRFRGAESSPLDWRPGLAHSGADGRFQGPLGSAHNPV